LSYQLTPKLVVRTGYGIFFVPSYTGSGPADGYTQTTPIVGTLVGFLPNDTLSNPLPTGILQPQGSALGGQQDVGYGVPAVRSNRASTYLQQWTFGVQYSLRTNDLIDIAYVGNRGVKMFAGTFERDQLDPKYFSLGQTLYDQVPNPFYKKILGSGCGLDGATVTRQQLLRPYPQYCSVSEQQATNGDSYYDALQMTYTHRFHAGFSVLASYTFSKFIDDVAGNNGWSNAGPTSIRNYYNLAAEKSVDGNDIPHSLVVSYIYELPVGRGKKLGSNLSKPVDAIVGGWQLSGISTFKSGFPLSIAPANNTLGTFGANQRPNIVGDVHIANRSIAKWFNTAAFADPAPFTFGNAARYLSDLRAPGYENWDLSIQKYWRFGEVARLQFRAEFYNAFNHPNFYAPNQYSGSGPAFGTITNALAARDTQFGFKFYW
jgi:hypothetical protein